MKRSFFLLLFTLLSSCGVFPDELNFSPLYRHRVAPDGRLAELDILWPLFHWERMEDDAHDLRIRPFWRRITSKDRKKIRNEFIAPLGLSYEDEEEFSLRFMPLFQYREHLHEGRKGAYDRDWMATPLVWGGSSTLGENYFAFFPFYGTLKNFLTYDKISFALFPLHLWTKRGKTKASYYLWPLIGWGSSEEPDRPHWWRVLPFYGESIYPGHYERFTALWPFFHWGRERLNTDTPASSFFFFPLFGYKSSAAFLSWTFLWPFFKHGHARQSNEKEGDYSFWDFPWPLIRYLRNSWDKKNLRQWWIMPLVASTMTKTQRSLLLLYPLIWNRHFEDQRRIRDDFWFIPFFWNIKVHAKKKDGSKGKQLLKHTRIYPLFRRKKENRRKNWQILAPWPYDGQFAAGVDPAYDWIWTLATREEDRRGNSRFRSFAHLFSSRNFAGRRYQASVPFLFNLEKNEDGSGVFRLFQFFPFSWGPLKASPPKTGAGALGEAERR